MMAMLAATRVGRLKIVVIVSTDEPKKSHRSSMYHDVFIIAVFNTRWQ